MASQCGIGTETPTETQKRIMQKNLSYSVQMRDAAIRWHKKARGAIGKVESKSLKIQLNEARQIKASQAQNKELLDDRLHRERWLDRMCPHMVHEMKERVSIQSDCIDPTLGPLPELGMTKQQYQRCLEYQPGRLETEFFIDSPNSKPSRKLDVEKENLYAKRLEDVRKRCYKLFDRITGMCSKVASLVRLRSRIDSMFMGHEELIIKDTPTRKVKKIPLSPMEKREAVAAAKNTPGGFLKVKMDLFAPLDLTLKPMSTNEKKAVAMLTAPSRLPWYMSGSSKKEPVGPRGEPGGFPSRDDAEHCTFKIDLQSIRDEVEAQNRPFEGVMPRWKTLNAPMSAGEWRYTVNDSAMSARMRSSIWDKVHNEFHGKSRTRPASAPVRPRPQPGEAGFVGGKYVFSTPDSQDQAHGVQQHGGVLPPWRAPRHQAGYEDLMLSRTGSPEPLTASRVTVEARQGIYQRGPHGTGPGNESQRTLGPSQRLQLANTASQGRSGHGKRSRVDQGQKGGGTMRDFVKEIHRVGNLGKVNTDNREWSGYKTSQSAWLRKLRPQYMDGAGGMTLHGRQG